MVAVLGLRQCSRVAFKLIAYLGDRWADGDERRLVMVAIASVVGSLGVRVSSAVTAGVTLGRKNR